MIPPHLGYVSVYTRYGYGFHGFGYGIGKSYPRYTRGKAYTFLVEGFTKGLSPTELLTLRIWQLERRPEDIAEAARALKGARFKSQEEFEWKYRRRM